MSQPHLSVNHFSLLFSCEAATCRKPAWGLTAPQAEWKPPFLNTSDVVWQTDSFIYLYFNSTPLRSNQAGWKAEEAARKANLHVRWVVHTMHLFCLRSHVRWHLLFCALIFLNNIITEQWKESRERRTVAVRRMKRQIAACFYVFLPQII